MSDNTGGNSQWEKQALQRVLLEHIYEQRRARRWSIFFKLLMLSAISLVIYAFYFNRELPQPVAMTQAHTAVIDIKGDIGAEHTSNAQNIRESLKTAFESKHSKGIILRINSPGGSPVQARQIFDEIRHLKAEYPDMKIYAAIEDMGTSAAYLIAAATDYIYADETSLVGSIGVKLDSFGYTEAMQKFGVERRLYTAGTHKGILDPFSPRVPEEDAFINAQLQSAHQAFIENIREGRGDRLKETPEMFSGLFWTGEGALKLGLIDGFGDTNYIAREIIKTENTVDYTPTTNFLDRFAKRVGASMATTLSLQMGLQQKGAR